MLEVTMDRTIRGRALLTTLAGALLLAGCDTTAPAPEVLNIRGVVTVMKVEGLQHSQALAELLIEEDPSIPLEAYLDDPLGFDSRKIIYVVLPSTRILREAADGSAVPATLAEIGVGATVRAWNTGFVVDTAPQRAYADKILIVEPAP
jgi:hypothetical protein